MRPLALSLAEGQRFSSVFSGRSEGVLFGLDLLERLRPVEEILTYQSLSMQIAHIYLQLGLSNLA